MMSHLCYRLPRQPSLYLESLLRTLMQHKGSLSHISISSSTSTLAEVRSFNIRCTVSKLSEMYDSKLPKLIYNASQNLRVQAKRTLPSLL